MSLETWKKAYYPISAETKMSTVDAIKHSLLKWEGLLKVNRRKHGVGKLKYEFNIIFDKKDNSSLIIDNTTCALCHTFLEGINEGGPCQGCPLFILLGNERCDDSPGSVYSIWFDCDDARPMIKALKKCLKENA